MKNFLLTILLLAGFSAYTQDYTEKWGFQVGIGHYPASIVNPAVGPFRPGLQLGISRKWNEHPKHQFIQSFNAGYFYHRYVQGALQFYSELGYKAKLSKTFAVQPLMLGGGYVLSIINQTSLRWNNTDGKYEEIKFPTRHNWMVTLGPSLFWQPSFKLMDRPVTISLDYRLQVQGIFINNSAPVIAYAPLRLGIILPISQSRTFPGSPRF